MNKNDPSMIRVRIARLEQTIAKSEAGLKLLESGGNFPGAAYGPDVRQNWIKKYKSDIEYYGEQLRQEQALLAGTQ